MGGAALLNAIPAIGRYITVHPTPELILATAAAGILLGISARCIQPCWQCGQALRRRSIEPRDLGSESRVLHSFTVLRQQEAGEKTTGKYEITAQPLQWKPGYGGLDASDAKMGSATEKRRGSGGNAIPRSRRSQR
jgi:hypothetical protein